MTGLPSLDTLMRILLSTWAMLAAFVSASPDPAFTRIIQPLIDNHCIQCHGQDGKVKGKVNLLEIDTSENLVHDIERLGEIIEVLEFSEMPPEDEPQPDNQVRQDAVKYLKGLLKREATKAEQSPMTPIRRMNRFQYNNAIQDLFQLNVSVFTLPERMMREYNGYFDPASGKMPDSVRVGSRPLGKSQLIEPRLVGIAPYPQDLRAEHGFDNRGDHLSLSPILMESFLRLSRSIVNSPNFSAKTCGTWKQFFAPPLTTVTRETFVERLRPFLTRAFREPVSEAQLNRYASHAHKLVEDGTPFTEAMKEVASATIASPHFLYLRHEKGDYGLAARLSFLLWGSIPDQQLLDVAAKGTLRQSPVLKEQVNRLLSDRKLKRFCDSFPAQWLQLDRIISSVPDIEKFRDFFFAAPNYRTSMDMMAEPLLLFETILIENRSILELIDSNFSYRSVRLQTWYDSTHQGKLGGPTTLNFQRIPLTDRRQGGVITTAATMTMTSAPDHTQPITRGAWMAAVIFNNPPDPPPADVPPLDEAEVANDLPLRERFAAHRERADCAGCHEQLDPLGFALENFDAVGRWRESYDNGQNVDASGVLFRKHPFTNVTEFKDGILAEKDRFTRAFAGHLLSYALAREISASDAPVLDQIVEHVKANDYQMKSLIHAIVASNAFKNP